MVSGTRRRNLRSTNSRRIFAKGRLRVRRTGPGPWDRLGRIRRLIRQVSNNPTKGVNGHQVLSRREIQGPRRHYRLCFWVPLDGARDLRANVQRSAQGREEDGLHEISFVDAKASLFSRRREGTPQRA
jgi:hypothetical protein